MDFINVIIHFILNSLQRLFSMASINKNLCYKVILVGNCKVGKTSFLNYVIGKQISQKNLTPTIGVEYAPINIKVGSNDIRVNIWDTSGAEQYKSITKSYYRKSHGVIIMFDMTQSKSFKDLKLWLKQINNQTKTSKIPKIILANKYDLVQSGQKERAISEKQIVDFCVQNGLNFRETSAKTGLNVKQTLNQFVQLIYEYKNTNIQEEKSSERLYISEQEQIIQLQKSSCAKCC